MVLMNAVVMQAKTPPILNNIPKYFKASLVVQANWSIVKVTPSLKAL